MTNEDSGMERLFEKMVAGLEALAKSQTALDQRLARLEKEAPPKMDTETVEGPAEGFNPQEKGAEADDDDNFPSKDASTKPASATTSGQNIPAHNMAKKAPAPRPATKPVQKALDVEALIAKAVTETNKTWEAKLPELIKAHTPLPFGMPNTPEAQMWAKDPFAFIRKAVEADRANCGGSYSVEEGRFGFKTGAGDTNARAETAKFIRKALEG